MPVFGETPFHLFFNTRVAQICVWPALERQRRWEGTFQPPQLLSSRLLLCQLVQQARPQVALPVTRRFSLHLECFCGTALLAAYGVKVLLGVSEVPFCPCHLWERTSCN